MSVELGLLKLFCANRDNEAVNYGYIDSLNNMERELSLLFNLVHNYYKEFDKDSISHEELVAYYDLKYPMAKEKALHLELMAEAFASHVTDDLMKKHIDHLMEKHEAAQLVNKMIPVMEGEKYDILPAIRTDIDNFVDRMHNPPDDMAVPLPCELDVEELAAQEISDGGVPWHLPELTEIIGGCKRQTLGLIYAFVDSGKTSFGMAACASFAEYLKETEDIICYCGNEEAAHRIRMRLVGAMCGWTKRQVLERPKRANKIAEEGGLSRVKIFDNITSTTQIEVIIGQYRPHIMFVDQATNVEMGGRREEGVQKLESLFRWFRKTATAHDIGLIGVAQAVGEAEDTKYLKLSDIYGSRVSIQGALDWACGIGRKVNNPIDDDLRYLNIPKNKLHDGEGGRMTVHFNKYISGWEVN
jgi:hypothetical protein